MPGGGGHGGGFGGGHRGGFRSGGGFHGGYRGPRRGGFGFGFFPWFGFGYGRGGGCLGFFLTPVLAMLLLALMLFSTFAYGCQGGGHSTEITASTKERNPLDSSYVTETVDYWSRSDSLSPHYQIVNATVKEGMRSFYRVTGVQPYLYVTGSVNGTANPTESQANAYTESLYHELFSDEGHLLIVLVLSDYDYGTWYWCGEDAWRVTDAEACEILLDYLDYYFEDYANGRKSLSDAISAAFSSAGDRIMGGISGKGSNGRMLTAVLLAVLLVVILALVAVYFRRRRNAEGGEKHYNDGSGYSDGF